MCVHRQDQLRGEYEVEYQQEGRPDPSAGPEGPHEGLDNPSVDTERVHSPRGWSCFYHIF